MINLLHYQSQLHQLVDQEVTIEPQVLLERLSKGKIFEFEGKSDIRQFPLKIQKTLEKVAKIRIGQELLTFFCHHQKKPLILQFSEEKSSFSLEKNTVTLEPNSFTLWRNTNESQWAHMPFKVTFVHELLHYKHSLENIDKYKKMAFLAEYQDLLCLEMDDAEEQLAICGMNADEKETEIVLCENHFRYAWNLPLRFTHRGVKSAKSTIQQNVSIEPERFAALFGRYHKKLCPASYRKQALIIKIAEPSHHQQRLIDVIKPFVQVHNVALIKDLETVKILEENELWDLDMKNLN